jgi:hypothetical protein
MRADELHGFVTKYTTEEDIDRIIEAAETAAPCAAPCNTPLSANNHINSDTVHEDCRCLYRDCRQPLLDEQDWRRRTCPVCWLAGGGGGDPDLDEPVFSPCQACGGKAHDVTTVKLRPLAKR